MVRLAPAPAQQVDQIDAGRLYKDGSLIGDVDSIGVAERRRLSFAGHVVVALALDDKGNLLADPDVALLGLPGQDRTGRPFEETVVSAALDTLESLPRPRRRDPDALAESLRRAVRASVREAWGKKPICTVFVTVV